MSHRSLGLAGALVLACSLLAAMGSAAVAQSRGPALEDVARIPNSFEADGPLIECSWVLPDAGLDAGMQYGSDDMAQMKPSEPGCTTDAAMLISGNRHLAQVVANPGNTPSTRAVELWAAVSHPAGATRVDDVFWRIYYPDGNFKQQIVGQALATDTCDDFGVGAVGENATPGSMFGAAVASGQLKSDYPSHVLEGCGSRRLAVFEGTTSIGYAEPCGEYRVEVHADADGTDAVSVHYFDVMCGQQLQTDFESVSWGTLEAGRTKWLFGADRLDGAGVPSLTNFGSGGVEVGVRFSAMQPTQGVGDAITEFGIAVRVAGTTATIENVTAGETVWFGLDGAICAGETAVLDAAVHPPATLGQGAYQGSIDVMTRPFNGLSVCANDLGALGAAGGADQRSTGSSSGPSISRAEAAPAATTTTTTTTSTSTTVAESTTTTSEPPDGSTTTTSTTTSTTTTSEPPDGSTTTTSTTTTTTSSTTTTTTTAGPPDTDAFPIPHVIVEPLEDGSLDVTVTIQQGVTIPGSEFDFSLCVPLYNVDTNGDDVNDGDVDLDGSFEAGEGWVYRCGFGDPPGDDLPFDLGDLIGG